MRAMRALMKALAAVASGVLVVKAVQAYIEYEHGRRWVPGMPSAAQADRYMDNLARRLADERMRLTFIPPEIEPWQGLDSP